MVMPETQNGVKYKDFDIKKTAYIDPPIVRNRPVEEGTVFELNLGGIDLSVNLSFDSLSINFPNAQITSSQLDFDEHKYSAFDYDGYSFEMEYFFEKEGVKSVRFSLEILQLTNRLSY